MATEAQKRAKKKYEGTEKGAVTHVQFDLYRSDQELIDYIRERAAIEGKAAFFRRIIRNDMEGGE